MSQLTQLFSFQTSPFSTCVICWVGTTNYISYYNILYIYIIISSYIYINIWCIYIYYQYIIIYNIHIIICISEYITIIELFFSKHHLRVRIHHRWRRLGRPWTSTMRWALRSARTDDPRQRRHVVGHAAGWPATRCHAGDLRGREQATWRDGWFQSSGT